jgi:hypothetical protein
MKYNYLSLIYQHILRPLKIKVLEYHKYISTKSYQWKNMPKTTLTLSEPVAKTLKIYTVQAKSSMRAQSQVVEEALIEFFERHNIKIET